jgi:putative FmdB family regulatory protein
MDTGLISAEGVKTLPLYAYRCTQCGHKFEKIQNFSTEPESVCPKCGGVLERPLTAPRLNFKGAGWYVNDYAPKSSAAESSSDSGVSGKTTDKTETKSGEGAKSTDSVKSTDSAPATPAPAAKPSTTPSSTE